ncbi:MAG: MBL fold metallo-hydrolase [Proteobacteria bacterium]|nr:MBL fold metallo-hydrolase [Pseudomonadota bacterium]
MATITFFGAALEVTGSCHLLESSSTGRVILDCGMHQGGDAVKRISKDKFEFEASSLDAVILSHAHLDHSGLLPKLVSQGFDGPIYCTAATADLLRIMLNDAFGLYERDMERKNLRLQRKGKRTVKLEYSQKDVDKVMSLCVGVRYRSPREFRTGASVTFHDAGHILGSAIVEVVFEDEGRQKHLVYSGDLGNADSTLMNDPAKLQQADLVLMESTYGNRDHRDMDQTLDQLRDILADTWNRGGSVLIPSFAVGRTQEILFHLGCLQHDGLLDGWKVYLDSPMAIEVTSVYDKWLRLLDDEDVRKLTEVQHKSLVEFLPTLSICITPEESMAINDHHKGVIVIAGSGMCTGGRIRHHMKHRIWRAETTMLFIGFQAQGTLGRNLVDGAEKIRMFGDEFAVKATIETLGGFSAHAGQAALIEWAASFQNSPQFALVHGEPQAMQVLAGKLSQEKQIQCQLPARGEQISF